MLTSRMVKNDLVLEHLKETYIACVYFTKPTRTLICCLKHNFSLNNSKDVTFLIALGNNSQIFESRDMVSVLKHTEQLHILFRLQLEI